MRIYLYRLGGLQLCDPLSLYLLLLLLFSGVLLFLLFLLGIGFRVSRLGYPGYRGKVSNHA